MVRDNSVESTAVLAEKADTSNHGHIAAPFAGAVTAKVAVGDTVEAGATVATIEAMKMEAGITSTVAGTVQRLAIGGTAQVQGGDLLLVVEAAELN
ncbi:biotin/lipoyl-containing protein, partial [Paeniglutamicibacter sp. NPDC091659]|uniref:biotin/lipoyl-containing protein n=1 Tax=Paeniglutamicibacter sp. NPDC091659 TaxID=3364389 RepID=UPI0037F1EC05